MSEEEGSDGNLPPGKLQDLKKLFEEKSAAGAISFGASPPKPAPGGGKSRPVSMVAATNHPVPAPRHGSPNRKSFLLPDSVPASPPPKPSTAQEIKTGYGTLPQPLRRKSAKDHEWSSTLEKRSSEERKLAPSVSRQVALFSQDSGCEAGDACSESERADVERRHPQPLARSGHPKRLSDPCSDAEGASGRRRCNDRRKTVDNVPLDVESKSNNVKSQDPNRRPQEKPSLPKKPVIASPAHNQPVSTRSPQKDVVKSGEQGEAQYEDPWDIKPGKITERLNAMRGDQSSSKPKPSPAQGACKQVGKEKTGASPKTKGQVSKQIARPAVEPPPPPYKPPRTFAHNEYLEGKVQGQPSDSQNKSSSPPKGMFSAEKDTHRQEVNLRKDRMKENSSHSVEKPNEMIGIREKPPTRPPPPRPRPVSEASNTPIRHGNIAKHKRGEISDDDQGVVVISTKTGKRVARQVSMSGVHRNPGDKLPAPPDSDESVQRYPIRKSYSSECLVTECMSSMSDLGVEEDFSQRTMMQSCYVGDAVEPVYGAMVDTDGYAVPNQFIRLNSPRDNAFAQNQRTPNRAGVRRHFNGPPASLGAAPPSVPVTTPIKDQDVGKVPARKMNIVKQKINQVYESSLEFIHRWPATSEEIEQDSQNHPPEAEDDSMDTDSIVDAKEIERRVTYCSTVRKNTHKSVRKAREFMDSIYPQLFEYALIVGLSAKTDDPGYDPVVLHKFPQTVESNMSIPKFCFPDAADFRPGTMTATSESYAFVLTNIEGGRMYGYCRRMQPHDSSLPEVICIISPVQAANMYNKLLIEIEAQRFKSMDNAQEVIAASFGRPLPKPGKTCFFRSLNEKGELETMFLERPSDYHLANVNYESLLLYLGTDKLIQLFASMLMERRLILCSRQLSVLTQTIHALVALLYPFQWQHIYIPLLPPDMVEVCAAPMPFIIGILHSHLARVTTLDLEDVIILDVDNKKILRSAGDELTILPRKVQKALKTAINMCKIDSDARNSQWLMVSEAFLRMFIETVGHFNQHIFTQQDGTRMLLKDVFIARAPSKGIRQFLEWFTETQMFEVFINMYTERQHMESMDLFLSRLEELQEKRRTLGSQVKGIGQKVKNFGKVIKNKLMEAT